MPSFSAVRVFGLVRSTQAFLPLARTRRDDITDLANVRILSQEQCLKLAQVTSNAVMAHIHSTKRVPGKRGLHEVTSDDELDLRSKKKLDITMVIDRESTFTVESGSGVLLDKGTNSADALQHANHEKVGEHIVQSNYDFGNGNGLLSDPPRLSEANLHTMCDPREDLTHTAFRDEADAMADKTRSEVATDQPSQSTDPGNSRSLEDEC